MYRIQQIFSRQQVDISRFTMCGWMKAAAEVVRPLYDLICQRIRPSEVLHTDDTTVPVMDAEHCRTGRQWTYAGDYSHPYIAYDFTPTRSRDGPLAWPILQRIKLWLDAEGSSGTVLPKSPIGQAITYARNQWPALQVYISNGNLSIDNNAAERALRRVAIGRKNWLWAGTGDGRFAAMAVNTKYEVAGDDWDFPRRLQIPMMRAIANQGSNCSTLV